MILHDNVLVAPFDVKIKALPPLVESVHIPKRHQGERIHVFCGAPGCLAQYFFRARHALFQPRRRQLYRQLPALVGRFQHSFELRVRHACHFVGGEA
jgi:hypothetical protein